LFSVALELAIERDRLSFDYSRPGKLVIYNTPEAIEVAKKQMEFQRTLGCQQTLLLIRQYLT
jgi:D-amino-acid dehydrogenase